jgi:NADH-quinone oxidoreductase subunit L
MLDNLAPYLWLIPALPLLASAVTAFFGPRFLKEQSHWPCIVGAVGACFISFLVLFAVMGSDGEALRTYYTWFSTRNMVDASGVDIGFSLRADGLSAIMLVTVTFIGLLIAIYSIGYMHGDPGYPRYFAEIALFLFAMTGLVLADNFILLYAFWEGVGLCSYLLIGFWFAKPSASAAARKAFLVTRIGDVGLFIGILLLWANVGHTLDFNEAFARAYDINPGTLTWICILFFCGAVGKSAQFPLHVWLPDAMEGPSPVSALIHAATMVTAGVYLVARCTPLFALAPGAQIVVACIGAFTALLAALMALTQTDLKRVLAYSTISQLGFMFLALGSATAGHVVILGVTAAIFHLFTHAFFKALLFLGAGSVMHAMGNVIDMRKFGGLRKVLPHTHWTFLCGSAALAGIIPFAGFWSKDEILAAAWDASSGFAGGLYFALFLVALLTAGLTAFYTFRAYFMTFWGPEKIPDEAGHHAHESPPVMTVPLMILAAGAVLVGAVFGPTGLFGGVLEQHWMHHAFHGIMPQRHEHHPNFFLMGLSTLVALGGVGLAYLLYVRQPALPGKIARSISVLYAMSRNRFFLDEIYNVMIVKPFSGVAFVCFMVDQLIVDQIVDLVGKLPSLLGRLFSPIQNGLVQFYALLMILGLVGFLISMLLRL